MKFHSLPAYWAAYVWGGIPILKGLNVLNDWRQGKGKRKGGDIMGSRKYDRQLGIRTVGLREWDGNSQYNRYEATPPMRPWTHYFAIINSKKTTALWILAAAGG